MPPIHPIRVRTAHPGWSHAGHHTKEVCMALTTDKAGGATEIRPFRVEVPEEVLVELRRRVQTARWPEKETVTDPSQGVQLATMQALARYWGSDYELRRFQARLNAVPQFITEIDSLDIHFLHLRAP